MEREFLVGVCGNPNTGKSTLFNQLTGVRQHVGNYPGVTVEKKEGILIYEGVKVRLVDLPGIYSLSAYSPEEIIARDFIINSKPDLVVDIIDCSNLDRNLYLALQLMELGVPLIFVFNMSDEAEKKGIHINTKKMSELLGVPIVKTVGHRGIGVDELKKEIVRCCTNRKFCSYKFIKYGSEIDSQIEELKKVLDQDREFSKNNNTFWIAIKLIEKDEDVKELIKRSLKDSSSFFDLLEEKISYLESLYGEDTTTIMADARYGLISGIINECVKRVDVEKRHMLSDKVDLILTHRFLGIPIFLALMYLVFWFTFNIGSVPMEWIDSFFGFLTEKIDQFWNGSSYLKSLFLDGIIGGVGAVLVFLPNIMLLFLAIGILEYSGYMARAAFIIDRVMHKIGLHGKSFIPMLIGFGCNVPGIMATRTLESKRERLLTILVLPLMSCGARLPIYLLIISAFFPKKLHTPMLWLIYLIGVILAIVSAKLLKHLLFKGETSPFVMELPPYRVPTLKSLMIYVWEKSFLYLKKAGTIILAASIVLWFLSTFPKPDKYSIDYERAINEIKSNASLSEEEKERLISDLEIKKAAEEVENSYMGRIGKFLEPVFSPLGFDWKITTAVLGALSAKEVFVSQLGIINRIGETAEDSESLREILKKQYDPLTGFCIMLWALVSAPCIATFAMTKQETGSWKWAIAQFLGLTLMAYVVVLITYQIGSFVKSL